MAARTCQIRSPSRTGPGGPASAGSQTLSPPGAGMPRCTRGSRACRDTAVTLAGDRPPWLVTDMATSSMDSPVPMIITGLPSATASSAPGAHGSATKRGLAGTGIGATGGGLPLARMATSASRQLPSPSTSRTGRPPAPGRTATTSAVSSVSRDCGAARNCASPSKSRR